MVYYVQEKNPPLEVEKDETVLVQYQGDDDGGI